MNLAAIGLAAASVALCFACSRLSLAPHRFADLKNKPPPTQDVPTPHIGIDAVIAAVIACTLSGGTVVEAFEEQGGIRFATPRITMARAQSVLRRCAKRDESEEDIARAARQIAATCALSERLGCKISSCLQAAAEAYQRERNMRNLKQEAFAMPKATIRLLSALPAVTVALGELMGSRPLRFLFGSAQGLLCLLVGLIWYGFGLLWTRHMLNEFETSADTSSMVPLTLRMLHAALLQGSSIPTALVAVGQSAHGDVAQALRLAGSALIGGTTWREAWIVATRSESGAACSHSAMLIANCLEGAWRHGSSPTQQLTLAAQRFDQDERSAIKQAASRLSVRLLGPTGLCFLPAFILIGVVPTVASFAL